MFHPKLFMTATLSFILLSFFVFIPVIRAHATTTAYAAQLVSKSADAELSPGQSVILWVKYKNTGTATWDSDKVALSTANPIGRDSVFRPDQSGCVETSQTDEEELDAMAGESSEDIENTACNLDYTKWIDESKTMMDSSPVKPGETASFGFWITAPIDIENGTYTESFQPFSNSTTYFSSSSQVSWKISIKNAGAVFPITNQTQTPSKVAESNDIFYRFDDNGDGAITGEEFTRYIEEVLGGQTPEVENTPNNVNNTTSTGTKYNADRNIKDYAYSVVSKSTVPKVTQGDIFELKVTLKNTGKAAWYKNADYPLHLGTADPLDRESDFAVSFRGEIEGGACYDEIVNDTLEPGAESACTPEEMPRWISSNRVIMEKDVVKPGQTTAFIIIYKAISSSDYTDIEAGPYVESFQPVIEGLGWIKGSKITWNITVKAKPTETE
ncbi:MAG TPA: hypothetical protein P5096_01630 [Patescibacteria group bacterium]|nr:hypothetical protein [Patescibacteria group bacterium]